MYGDGDRIRLSGSSSGDIPKELRGVEMCLVKQVAYSHRHGSSLYSALTDTGETWIVRGDWIESSEKAPGRVDA